MLWRIWVGESQPITLPDMSSMDVVTHQLPGGFYTTFRTFFNRTRVIGLENHLDRLYVPSHALGIQPGRDRGAMRREISQLLSEIKAGEARIRLILATEREPGTIYVCFEPLVPLDPNIYEQGVRVITVGARRADPALKTTVFIDESQLDRRLLLERSAFEGLMAKNGRILEGLTSNFFYVLNHQLGTARSGILNGVTRRQVLHLAEGQGIRLSYHALSISSLDQIDEAFLTSSSRGIVPIIQIDQVVVGNGGVGEFARRLMKAYARDIERRSESI
jgi:branched-chain amino acid aminotransferase